MFEKVLKKHIVRFMEDNNLFNPNQHGFRRGRSCLSELLNHFDDILNELVGRNNVDVVYLDFSKAFDKVDFKVLLRKLYHIGIRGKLLSWIEAFLTGRTLYVVIDGVKSLPCPVLSGVPQGSVLGPLLFLILIMDIDKDVKKASVKSFADDTRVLKSISNSDDINVLQSELHIVYSWAGMNNLQFNNTKFELIQYGKDQNLKSEANYLTVSNQCITKKDIITDLGVLMSDDATFKPHVTDVVNSAKKLVSWIYRSFKTRSATAMLTLWKSMILPKLEYCSQLWSPFSKGEIMKLELIQRYFVKKIENNWHLDYWETLAYLKLFSLERRRERYRIMYTWKVLENIVPNISANENRKITPRYTDRFGRKCVVPPHQAIHSAVYENSMAVRGPKLFNVMPQAIRDLTGCTIETFKAKLDKFLWTVADNPLIPGYRGGNNQLYGSNSLVDILSGSY